jgi:hypothetical protein
MTKAKHPLLRAYRKLGSYQKLAHAIRPGMNQGSVYRYVQRAEAGEDVLVPATWVRALADILDTSMAAIRPDLFA